MQRQGMLGLGRQRLAHPDQRSQRDGPQGQSDGIE